MSTVAVKPGTRGDAKSKWSRALPPHVRWPMLIVSLLAVNVAICTVTVVRAVGGGGAAVEPSYDRKAQNFEASLMAVRASAALGWSAEISAVGGDAGDAETRPSLMRVVMRDRSGQPIDDAVVRVTAFHQSRADQAVSLTLVARGLGVYEVPLNYELKGFWEVRLTAVRAGEKFQSVQSVFVTP